MSIASRISAMQEHLRDDYDVLDLAGADLTNVDKNIVNLKPTWKERLLYFMNNGTDEVWNNWNKVTGEGEEISLNNTLEGKMKIVLKGNTYQDTTTGKNKLNVPSTYAINGVVAAISLINTIPAGTYTISCGNVTKGGAQNPRLRINDYFIELSSNLSFTITIPSEITSAYFYSNGANYVESQGVTSTVENLMISTSGGDYEPYTNGPAPNPDYPQDIHVVSGDNEINVVGKNLFDLDWVVYRTTNGITATKGEDCIVLNGTATATAYINFAFPSDITSIIDTTAHTWFFKTTQNISKIQIQRDTGGVVNILNPTTLTKNTFGNILTGGYVEISSGTTLNNCKVYIDVRKGILTLDGYEFAPHQEQTYPINLGSIELCKIGDYQDSIVKDNGKWYLRKAVEKVDLGDLTWTSQTWGYQASADLTNIVKPATTNTIAKILCNVYIACTPNNAYGLSGNIEHGISLYGSNIMVRETTITSLNDFNDMISSAYAYLVLATPTYEEITDTTLLSQLDALEGANSYNNQTNVSQTNNDLASVLNATALEDIS